MADEQNHNDSAVVGSEWSGNNRLTLTLDGEPGGGSGGGDEGPKAIDICPADKRRQRACLCCGLVKVCLRVL